MKIVRSTLMLLMMMIIIIEYLNHRAHEFLNDIEFRANRLIDQIEKRLLHLFNESLAHLDHRSEEKVESLFEKSRYYNPFQNPYGATTCTKWFGCHQGYCWSGCAGAFPSVNGPEWCYTTNSSGKVSCQIDDDCHGCWRCSSACSL